MQGNGCFQTGATMSGGHSSNTKIWPQRGVLSLGKIKYREILFLATTSRHTPIDSNGGQCALSSVGWASRYPTNQRGIFGRCY
jgi:hypothetical protein